MERHTSFLVLIAALMLAACGGGDGLDPSASAGDAAAVPAAPASSPAGSASSPAAAASTPAATIAVTERGTALGPIVEMAMTAVGGTLVSADGQLAVDVPPGALPPGQKISIQAVTNTAPGATGMGYELLPEGQTFAAPVRLSFRYGDADVAGSAAAELRIAFQEAMGRWEVSRNVVLDEIAKTVSVETTHFSHWTMVLGVQLGPRSASVAAGKAIDFKVFNCLRPELFYMTACETVDIDRYIQDWTVNGIGGGSLAVGQVASSQNGTARYTAPGVPPARNPVVVSAQLAGRTKVLLNAVVWIGSFPPLSGTITSTQISPLLGNTQITWSTTANVEFKYDLDEQRYRITSGTVVSHEDAVDTVAGCEYHVRFAGAIGANDGAISIQEDGRYVADGITLAPHTGTTTCTSDKALAPLTLPQAGARWWPAPPAPNPLANPPIAGAMELRLRPDGRLEESLTWTTGPGGTETTVQWSLRPAAPRVSR